MPSDSFNSAAFYDILTMVQKSYILATNRGAKTNFQNQNTTRKVAN
jgi:hypothetical protein